MKNLADILLDPSGGSEIVMGNTAIVRAMIESGVRVVTSYPGSPTPEIADAISRPGFNLVEALTPCFTQYGRGNGFKSAVEMFKWLKSSCLPVERYEKLEDRTGKLPIGTFVRRDVAGLETRWANMRQALAAKKGGAA